MIHADKRENAFTARRVDADSVEVTGRGNRILYVRTHQAPIVVSSKITDNSGDWYRNAVELARRTLEEPL